MSRRRRTPDDWRREVYRASTLSERTKLLLVFLSEHMHQDRRVSIPREQMAKALGKSERRITERISEAHDAGWLDTIVHGRKGLTAVYQGLFPDADSGTDARPLTEFSGTPTSPLKDAETRPLNPAETGFRGRTCVPPLEERTSSVGQDDRNGGSKEEAGSDLSPLVAEASTTECPHGMPGGEYPDPFDDMAREPSCPACWIEFMHNATQPADKRWTA